MAFSGNKLRELREKAGLERRELATQAGTTMQYISHLENGVKLNPAFDLVERLADALGVTCSAFRGEDPHPTAEEPTAPAKPATKKGKKT